MNSDRIEKKIILRASRERVWQAISDSTRFGAWFGVEFDGPFVEGSWLTGRIAPTKVDPEIARLQEPARGMRFSVMVDRVEPMERFSFRWHPFAIDPNYDYSRDPTTLVAFELREADGAVLLTITESGFEALPGDLRGEAFRRNDGGWSQQMKNIEIHVTS